MTSPSSPTAPRIPGEAGLWILIFGDMVVFSAFFIAFLYDRGQDVELYVQSAAHLNRSLGVLNTFLMLTSSWFVATAIRAAREGLRKTPSVLLAMAFLCGFGFGVVKFFEYAEKIRAGITVTTNDFFQYYFMLTGIHMFHVVVAMAVVLYLIKISKDGKFTDKKLLLMECGGVFWHLVDMLWIVLFSLLYLIK